MTPASGPQRYADAVAALQSRGRFGIRLGLGRTRALLRALGDPHHGLRGALIAGTNGKGSVQAMAASALRAAGYRVGQTPSPHLVTYRERVSIDGEPIGAANFTSLVGEVLRAEERVARRQGHATEFELLTAAAFTWFARERVDVAVVEVGLGGRLDATNVWDGGVAAVTNVDWDHTDRLGATLEAIAREKAAIIKHGNRAVTGASDPGLTVIRQRAQRVGATLREVEPYEVVAMDRGGLTVRGSEGGELRVSLLGRHQAANAAVAVAVLEELTTAAVSSVSPEAIKRGLASTAWPGRLELLTADRLGRATPVPAAVPASSRDGADVLLDGAHNVAGVNALVAAWDELRASLSPGPPTLVLGLMSDKDVPGMLGPLVDSSLVEGRIIATNVEAARALPADALAKTIGELGRAAGRELDVSAAAPVAKALGMALDSSRERQGPLVVAGSLYLVGEVRARLLRDPLLDDPKE